MANENQYYLYPFGENGDRQTVPDQGAGGNVGFESGYGSDYELPQGDPNRKRIPRLTHNEILYGITKNIKQSQEENWPTWIEDQGDTNPFPYDAGVIVKHPATNQLWISNVDNNQSVPGADTNWTAYQSTSPIALNKIKTSQFVVEGTTGDPLPSAVPTSYPISAEMAFGWVVTTAVVNATKDSNGNVIADSGVVRYTIDKAENDTPLASQIFASVMRCTNAASSTYVQDYAAAGNGISVSESATEIYIDIDFSDFSGGVVFGASEQRGRLEILSVEQVTMDALSSLGYDFLSNGYHIFESGFIFQWQIATGTSGGAVNSFPIPFPNASLGFSVADRTTGVPDSVGILPSPTNSQFTLFTSGASSSVYVISVGN